jgi:hypothetical protein
MTMRMGGIAGLSEAPRPVVFYRCIVLKRTGYPMPEGL